MNPVCKIDDRELNTRGWKVIDCFGGKTCLILKDENGLRGFVNVCPHANGPTQPEINEAGERVLKCQLHGSQFDIITGKALTPPASLDSSLRSLQVTEKGGVIYYE